MLLAAAVTGIVTFIVTLSMLFFNLNNRMVLIEDSSKVNDITSMVPYYSGKVWEGLAFTFEGVFDTVIVFQTQTLNGIRVVKEITDSAFTRLQVMENLQLIHGFTVSSINGTVAFYNTVMAHLESPLSILGIEGKWIYSIGFGLCVLFVLLTKREVLLNHFENDYSDEDLSDSERNSRTSRTSITSGQTSGSEEEREHIVSAVETLYLKLFCALENASYLSKKPFCMTPYTVRSPMVCDVLPMLDPLMEFITEGIHNITLLKTEYYNQLSKLTIAEEKINTYKGYKGCLRNQQEVALVINEKNTEIKELQEEVCFLQKKMEHFQQRKSVASAQLTKINEEMRAEGERCDEIKMMQQDSEKEARSLEAFVKEEIKEEISWNKSMKRRYRNVMKHLIRMVLKSSGVHERSVERFVSGCRFDEFLTNGNFHADLENLPENIPLLPEEQFFSKFCQLS